MNYTLNNILTHKQDFLLVYDDFTFKQNYLCIIIM